MINMKISKVINEMDLEEVIVDNHNNVVQIKGTDSQLQKLEKLCKDLDVECEIDTMYQEKKLVMML